MIKKYNSFILNENTENVKCEVLSTVEFGNYIKTVKNKKRFQEFDKGGVFKFFLYTDFNDGFDYNTLNAKFFTIKVGDLVVGLAHFFKSPYREKTWWLSYICIDEKYENKGYASELSEFIFKWFKDNDLTFETSSYSNS